MTFLTVLQKYENLFGFPHFSKYLILSSIEKKVVNGGPWPGRFENRLSQTYTVAKMEGCYHPTNGMGNCLFTGLFKPDGSNYFIAINGSH